MARSSSNHKRQHKEVRQYQRSTRPKTMKQRVTFQYRDADNYKFPFTAVVETATPIAVNEEAELPYESLGFTQERFHREIVKYPYDDTSDHNLLEVHEVENVADDTETDYQYAPAATPKEEKFP